MTDDEWIKMRADQEDGSLISVGGLISDIEAMASNGAPTPQEPLTLAKLTAMMEAMPKFPKYPPHYRCNQSTFDLMRSYMVQGEPSILKTVVGGCTIVIDQEVPEGEFWPPEGWEP